MAHPQRTTGQPRAAGRIRWGRAVAAVLVAMVVACALGAVALRIWPAVAIAWDLAGERWYRITLSDRQIGYLYSRSGPDLRGSWSFETDLRFVLQPGQPARLHQQLQFSLIPPFPLLAATQTNQRGSITTRSLLRRTEDGYRWTRDHAAGGLAGRLAESPIAGTALLPAAPERTVATDRNFAWPDPAPDKDPSGNAEPVGILSNWTFGLTDYLAVESWLRSKHPPAGATGTFPALDMARQQRTPQRYRVLGAGPDGYEIENPAPHEATRIRLDNQLQPTHMQLAGLFELEQVSRQLALAPRTALQAASYYVPLDRTLERPEHIRSLRLGVVGDTPATQLWPRLASGDGDELTLRPGTPSGLSSDREDLEETDQHPVSDSRIRRLAQAAVAGASTDAERAQALVAFVHGFLRYQDDAPQRHVLALLDTPEGDCSEYADLLTTLARSNGIPARTVFGLAYAGIREGIANAPATASDSATTAPAFGFHAWNELLVDGAWQTVDATWDQVGVDATHLPMPLDSAQALPLLTGTGNLRFVVREVRYD